LLSKLDRSLLAKYLRPQWRRAVLLGVVLLAGIVFQLANPQIAKVFIDRAQAGASFDRLVHIAVVFLGVALLTQVAVVAETYVAEDLGWRTTNALRADLTRHVLSLDGSFHSEHGAGELIERIDGDVSAIADFFSRFVLQVLGSAVFLAGVMALLFVADWRVGLLLSAFAAGALTYMTRGGSFVGARARRARRAAADLSGFVEERLGGLPDVKANGADAYVMRRMYERLADRFQCIASSAMGASLFSGTIGLFFVVGAGAALVTSALLRTSGAITLGTVYVVFRYTTMLRLPLERLSRQMNSFQQATGGVVRVRELLAVTSHVADGPGVEIPPGPLSVELDDVSFSYEDEPVLQRVSFRIEPGEVLGLLGRTGSGKTTISRLLFRLHDPVSGTVRMSDVDIRDANLDALRARIALVTQDVQLFDASVRDNVTLFDDDVSDERLAEVVGELGLREWLDALPDGLDTILGPHGRGLSAGEAQLVALARVFLKDPDLVVLDEASSRVDPATQALLERAITHLLAGRTAVVIAHRLATVDRANTILVLEEGRVAELGPRAALVADRDSRFSRLLRAGMAEAMA
jgi:ABC-type multidrug transport system fused ATPase/permease subunit